MKNIDKVMMNFDEIKYILSKEMLTEESTEKFRKAITNLLDDYLETEECKKLMLRVITDAIEIYVNDFNELWDPIRESLERLMKRKAREVFSDIK